VRPGVAEKLPHGSRAVVYDAALDALTAADLRRLNDALWARGRLVADACGRPIGKVVAVMVDRESGRPQWLAVALRDGVTAVPIARLRILGSRAYLTGAASVVSTAPRFESPYLLASVERALCRHYRCPPTRGALVDPTERRVTCSRAFWISAPGNGIGWLPAPRGSAQAISPCRSA
jgi:hypothetical protein